VLVCMYLARRAALICSPMSNQRFLYAPNFVDCKYCAINFSSNRSESKVAFSVVAGSHGQDLPNDEWVACAHAKYESLLKSTLFYVGGAPSPSSHSFYVGGTPSTFTMHVASCFVKWPWEAENPSSTSLRSVDLNFEGLIQSD
jgi:hypothetical protein